MRTALENKMPGVYWAQNACWLLLLLFDPTGLLSGESRVSRPERASLSLPPAPAHIPQGLGGLGRTECAARCVLERHLNLEGECRPSAFRLWDPSQGQ